ncbi:MAG: 1-deoxy-D-xylulose-5-phosphate synthase [Prevotella sp.]|uniref:1-deoxy-D-xylulose-5-phosphate synthase n=1 Tax=Prevotella sp. PTAC TaxID=2736295 RepID=UPI0015519ED9|nr:1-deoxy-D-xylulose-5-phosphate synthase [Prevotella sp. PTAC]MCX4292925.1 1-deoxy-D-xylulose-5-phosphate synthase [Prevotella sp.]NPD54001.1 1-deoxy-D-xylulose-5-phosphate synthase [Prevotella sp. PTAC]
MYLEKINSPKDIKSFSLEQLEILADEIRSGILNRVSNRGGHVGPNLGITEATIALNYVFDAPEDKFVFDVSHQIYPHKMLTGRAFGYTDKARFGEVSGYSSPLESSVYDCFEIGHTSTSVSLATGLQKARDIQGGKENIIAIIGDGSLSGGEAFEGLDTASELNTNIIIVVNDNEMSIAENHGGLYSNLRLLRETKGLAELNFFKTFGFEYMYVEEGNDIGHLIAAFKSVKDTPHPTVVHIHTEKGHGYLPATENKEAWHWHMPFDISTGELKNTGGGEYMPALLGEWLREEIKRDPKLVCIAAGVPASIGFGPKEREAAGRQFIDVGIAEEQAVAMASGMAKGGVRPVFSTHATFIQRTYDQLAQDLCVNGNPAVINVIGASIFGMSDFTHICFFDIPMLSHIPNLVYLAPTTYEELIAMESWAIRQEKYSVAIRVPECDVAHSDEDYDTDYSELDRFKMTRRGKDVAIIAVGDFYQKGENVVNMLEEYGIDATLINPRYLTGVDSEMLDSLKADHRLVVTIEDGCTDGGFGERIAGFYGATDMKTLHFGVKKALYDRYDVNELMRDNHLTDEQIVADIKEII